MSLILRTLPKEALKLGDHIANYLDRRTDLKPGTRRRWKQTERVLLEFFGSSTPLERITAGTAADFERWLKTGKARSGRYAERTADEGLASNTARKRIGDAKQLFQDAVSRELITRNPFAGLKGTVGSIRERDYFLGRADAAAVLAACPDNEWRVLFALSRFGGLRCPSEHLALTWGDVNWDLGRLTVKSPKTERHEGRESRVIPLFDEVRVELQKLYNEGDLAESKKASSQPIITHYRMQNTNLRTQLNRILKRAGLTPWSKLFQNQRASRATEPAAEHPAHVAAAWLGHSTLIANKHYWQVTDADFEAALTAEKKPTQNPTQQAAATNGKGQ